MRKVAVIPMLVRQHAEDAAFLFTLRSQAVYGQSWDEVQLGRCDQRIDANLAGLLAAGATGIEIAAEYVETVGGAGEVFVHAVLALAQDWSVDQMIGRALETPPGRKGLSGALARSDASIIGPHVKPWLASSDPGLRLLGLVALSHHRRDPGPILAQLLADPAPDVRSRAARLAFELGSADLAAPLSELAQSDPADPWPALAAARFANGAMRLYDFAAVPDRTKADLVLDVALLAAPKAARERLGTMLRTPQTEALALSRAGVTMDPSVAAWLWQQLDDEAHAEHALFALFDLYPLDPDLCGTLALNPERPATVQDWLAAHASDRQHVSLRRQMLDSLKARLDAPRAPLQNWRRTRSYPAWS